ncbi:MAG: PEP-utilizing enzyme [Candidatus Paceibacterota bacterium]
MNKNINQILDKLSNKVWRKRGKWHHSVLFDEIFAEGESTLYAKKLGYSFERNFCVWLENGDYLDLQSDWDSIRKTIEEGYKEDVSYMKKFADNCLLKSDELVAYFQKIKDKNFSKLSNKEVSDSFSKLVEELKKFMPFMMSVHLFDEILTEHFSIELSKFVKEKSFSQNDFFEYQTALTLPFRKILVLEEQDDLVKIALKLKKENLNIFDPVIKKLLEMHTQKYSWINAYLFENVLYSFEDFEKRLGELIKTDFEKEYLLKLDAESKLKKQQLEYMEVLVGYPELLELSKIIQVFGFLRSYRVDVLMYSIVMAWNLIEEIAKRIEIFPIDLKYLDSKEIDLVLNGSVNFDYQKIIQDRKNGFISVCINSDRYELTGEEAEKINSVVKLPIEKLDGVIKGTVAFPGKITARCKVLFSLDDMKKIEEGDVMVIAMTDPNYIQAMNRASAFVTDQGGILCHAAIVSREMKKPCIIGTKIATKVLKDGDLVEVDAEKGVVRILK